MTVRRTVRRARQVWRDLLWHSLHPVHVLGSSLRVELDSRADWMLFNDIFVEGEYDPAISLVTAAAPKDPLVLDLGANVGFFSLRFADRWLSAFGDRTPFRIAAVEGVPRLVREYDRRLSQPALKGRISSHCGLVGQRSGVAEVTAPRFHVTGSIGPSSRWVKRFRVQYLDLEHLLNPMERVALLKCDVEGAEQDFLDTYPELLERVDHAVFELHPERCDVPRCRKLLSDYGLTRIDQLADHGATATVELFSRVGG